MNFLNFLNYKYLNWVLYAITSFFITFLPMIIFFNFSNTFLVSSNFSDNLIEVLTEPEIRSMTNEEQQIIKAMILENEKDVVLSNRLESIQI